MPALFRFAALFLLSLALPPSAMGKEKVDLKMFQGFFRGDSSVTIAGAHYYGSAIIHIRVGNKGRQANMAVSGEFEINGRPFRISNRLTFSRTRTFTERSITNGFGGATVGVKGRYTARKRKLFFRQSFSANGRSGEVSGSIFVRQSQHRKKFLTFDTSITFDGEPTDYLYNFQVWNYVKP